MAEKDPKHYQPCVTILTVDQQFLEKHRPNLDTKQFLKDIKEKNLFSKAIVFRHKSTIKQSHAHVCIPVSAANKKFEKFAETFKEIVPRTVFKDQDDEKLFEGNIRDYFKKTATEIYENEIDKFESLAFCENFDVSVILPEKLSAWSKNQFFLDLTNEYKKKTLFPIQDRRCTFFECDIEKPVPKESLKLKRPSNENNDREEKVFKGCEERNEERNEDEDEDEFAGIEVPAELLLPILGMVPLTKPMQARYLSTKLIQEYMKLLRPRNMRDFENKIPIKTKLNLTSYIGKRWLTDADGW